MMHYAGVMAEASAAPEGTRVIQFPKGKYLVVKGEGKTADELNNKLAGVAFGQLLPMLVGRIQRLRWDSETAWLLVSSGFLLLESKRRNRNVLYR